METTIVDWKQWEGHAIDSKFHLRQYLGGSAHSGVFLTEYCQETPQTAVIKLIPADSGKAEAWMLRRELAARLSHPGLLPILDFGTWQLDGAGLVYVVMERADEDLSQIIPSRPLAPAEAHEMLTPVLDTLAYIHAEGFAHGSLTPANIMAAGDRVKISCDGLLRIGESSDNLWERNPRGAPESHAGVTPAGDVWSLGMTLVEVLTQRAPAWDHAGTGDPAVPEQLEAPFLDIARRCLRSDPRLRCSLLDIASTLHPATPAAQPPPNVVKTVSVTKPAAPKTAKRRPYLLPAVAGAILGVLIFAGVILTHASSSPAGTEPSRSVPSEQPAVQEKPETVPAAPVAKEAAAPAVESTTDAPAPAPAPAASVPATDASAQTVAPAAEKPPAVVEKLPAGDVVDRFVPDVPAQILGTIRGKVTVNIKARVDQSGAVVDAELDSRPGSKYFDKVALDAARRWKFKPASDAGSSVQSARMLRFEFRTDGCEASSSLGRP